MTSSRPKSAEQFNKWPLIASAGIGVASGLALVCLKRYWSDYFGNRKGPADIDFAKFVKTRNLSGSVLLGHFGDESKHAIVEVKNRHLSTEDTESIIPHLRIRGVTHSNNEYSSLEVNPPPGFGGYLVDVIYPASQRMIRKKTPQIAHRFEETPAFYDAITKPFIEAMPASDISWVYDIIDGKAEQERVIYQDSNADAGFVLLPDNNWTEKLTVDKFHGIAICNRRDIKTLRDLDPADPSHIELLKHMIDTSYKALADRFARKESRFIAYIHFLPTFYHFHIHFVTNFYHPGASCGVALPAEQILHMLERGQSPVDMPIVIRLGEHKHRGLLDRAREWHDSHQDDDAAQELVAPLLRLVAKDE